MTKTVRVTIEYEVSNSATLTAEKARVVDAARVFIASKAGDPVRLVSASFVKETK